MPKHEKVKKVNALLGVFIIIILLAISIGIYVIINNPNLIKFGDKDMENNNMQENKQEEIIPKDTIINIVGIGDTLCHSQNFKDAYDASTDTYDFSPMFKYVTTY